VREAPPAPNGLTSAFEVRLSHVFATIGLLVVPFLCRADPPIVYSASAYQSPVRAAADDLLLLPGYGFSGTDVVVYRAIDNTTRLLGPPAAIPSTSDAAFGVADMVSVVDAPFSLTIHMPAVIESDRSYALWVVNAKGEWSNGIRINDARPFWITPDEVYSTAAMGSLPRVLKVVGRNLQPQTDSVTRVQLVGPSATYSMAAIDHRASDRAIDRYVAAVNLPPRMQIGSYRIKVSRDGRNWVPLQNDTTNTPQTLRVLTDPSAAPRFPVGRYRFGACNPESGDCNAVDGTCAPDIDAEDDQTSCIAAAIAAARGAGGGVVVFGPGTWRLSNPGTWSPGRIYSSKGVGFDGILVPEGVSLQGAGRGVTRLVRGAQWDIHVPSFALLGHNTVTGFTFGDAHIYRAADQGTGFFMLGARWDRARAYRSPLDISHVVISDNEFDRPFIAIRNDGLGIDHLIVVHNIFGAFSTALTWEGNPRNIGHRYHYSDSIVAYNRFFPGSYLDLTIGQGAIASALSGSYRTDFSSNVADGASTAYLNDQADAKGWRAAYFWAMNDNVEMLLMSENFASCTGDKDGDGEAISYDNNHNRPDFLSIAVPVVATRTDPTDNTSIITVRASLIERQISYGSSIDVRPVSDYYLGDWLQVVQGAGLGQARKIIRISSAADAEGALVSFVVFPSFDVPPEPRSLVSAGRIYWQTYTVANTIDHRAPTCLKSNRTRPSGGLITLYASTVDSVVEGNKQYDTSGILLAHVFKLVDPSVGVSFPEAFIQSSNEVRGNEIDGAYDNGDKPLANQGIYIGYGATPHAAPPPTLSYALSISHNVVARAGASKGAISLNQGWYTGPASRVLPGEVTPWKIAEATLIFNNTLTDIGQPGATRVGIGLDATSRKSPIEWRSVLYGNSCNGTLPPQSRVADFATQTIAYCPRRQAGSCECAEPPTDLAVETEAPTTTAPLGGTVSYAVLVANRGPNAASGAMLSAEPTPGVAIKSMSSADALCDTENFTVNLCRFGSIAAGATARVNVKAEVTAIGEARTTFSVSHRESDSNTRNDGVVVSTHGVVPDADQPGD
jgi:uncharacterized protein DUF11